ncbi:MAG TPA: phosphotransferase, partial [Clostridia bacterium]|nr:phosphotransferase [Clostridia bacterium]
METSNDILSRVCKDIPNSESFVKIYPINKGVSGDDKYCVETTEGRRFLLRISEIESYERKKAMYDMMGRAASLGVSMSRPIDFGVCNGGKNVYQLLSWCDGVTADVLL